MNKQILTLTQISEEIGCNEEEINNMLSTLPIGDVEDITFLDGAGRWILEVSNLINSISPSLTSKERIAKKFKLMGKLLEFKAEEMVY